MFEQIFTVSIVALALGMDAFSLALGMGLKGVSRSFECKFIFTVAIFHVLMPLLGLNLGLVAGKFLGIWAARLGALVLVWLGGDFIIKAYRENKTAVYKFSEGGKVLGLADSSQPGSWSSIIMLGTSVSIDALTAGFSLGTLKMPVLFTVLLMGVFAGSMTWFGFIGGRIFSRWMGNYAQMLGGLVLLGLAIKLFI